MNLLVWWQYLYLVLAPVLYLYVAWVCFWPTHRQFETVREVACGSRRAVLQRSMQARISIQGFSKNTTCTWGQCAMWWQTFGKTYDANDDTSPSTSKHGVMKTHHLACAGVRSVHICASWRKGAQTADKNNCLKSILHLRRHRKREENMLCLQNLKICQS